jgi:hypothetical protein
MPLWILVIVSSEVLLILENIKGLIMLCHAHKMTLIAIEYF